MLNVLGENYFVDLDQIETFLDMSEPSVDEISGSSEVKINIIKFELVKMLLDVVLSEDDDLDEKLGFKGGGQTSIPFKIAFNSLLNKKLINHY